MTARARMKALPGGMLTHFTRGSGTRSALDNLLALLDGGTIRASRRMVRGDRGVVCLFDAPIEELASLLARRNRRRYQPFGIAIDKRYAFRMGARPAIYMPWREARAAIVPGELWRVVSLDLDRHPAVDWSFEREWRIAGDLALPARGSVALVESWGDADEVYDRFDGNPPCAGVIPLKDLFGPS